MNEHNVCKHYKANLLSQAGHRMATMRRPNLNDLVHIAIIVFNIKSHGII